MKGCLLTLILALVATAALLFLGHSCHRDRIESLYADRVTAVAESFPGIEISQSFFTTRVTGRATADDLEEIRERIDDLTQGRGRVRYDVDLIEAEPPPTLEAPHFSLTRNGAEVILEGLVDSEQTRAILARTAEVDGITVVDRLQVSPGVAPLPSLGSAVSAIPALIRSSPTASLEVTAGEVSIGGRVASTKARDELLALFSPDQWNGARIQGRFEVPPSRPPKMAAVESGDGANHDPADETTNPSQPSPASPEPATSPAIVMAPEPAPRDPYPGADAMSPAGESAPQAQPDPPQKKPASLSWRQPEPDRIELSGAVPDMEARREVEAAAREIVGESGSVVNRLEVSDQVSGGAWLRDFPEFARTVLSRITEPALDLSDGESSLSGKVESEAELAEVTLAFSGIDPPGKLDLGLKVVPPSAKPLPRRPQIEIAGTGQELIIRGQVPSRRAHDVVVNSILGMDDLSRLDDRLEIRDDVREEDWLEPLPTFIRRFYNGSVKGRQFSLRDGELVLEGTVSDEDARRDILALARPLRNTGIRVIDKLQMEPPAVAMNTAPNPDGSAPSGSAKGPAAGSSPDAEAMTRPGPPPPAGEVGRIVESGTPATKSAEADRMKAAGASANTAATDAATAPGRQDGRLDPIEPVNPDSGSLYQVFFGTGEFHIRTEEMPRAERMLERARSTKGRIVIDGFADERGEAELNDFLSEERADRVRQYLIANGIDSGRIVSVTGRGEISGGEYPKFRRADIRILD